MLTASTSPSELLHAAGTASIEPFSQATAPLPAEVSPPRSWGPCVSATACYRRITDRPRSETLEHGRGRLVRPRPFDGIAPRPDGGVHSQAPGSHFVGPKRAMDRILHPWLEPPSRRLRRHRREQRRLLRRLPVVARYEWRQARLPRRPGRARPGDPRHRRPARGPTRIRPPSPTPSPPGPPSTARPPSVASSAAAATATSRRHEATQGDLSGRADAYEGRPARRRRA